MKGTKRYVTTHAMSLVIWEMEIMITMRYHLMPVRMAVIKKQETRNAGMDAEKREHLCPAGGIVNWYSHYGGSSTN